MARNKKNKKNYKPDYDKEVTFDNKEGNYTESAKRKLIFCAEMIPAWKITLIDLYTEFRDNWEEESKTVKGHEKHKNEIYDYYGQFAVLVKNNDYKNWLPQYLHSVVVFWWQGVYQILILDNEEMYKEFNKEAKRLI